MYRLIDFSLERKHRESTVHFLRHINNLQRKKIQFLVILTLSLFLLKKFFLKNSNSYIITIKPLLRFNLVCFNNLDVVRNYRDMVAYINISIILQTVLQTSKHTHIYTHTERIPQHYWLFFNHRRIGCTVQLLRVLETGKGPAGNSSVTPDEVSLWASQWAETTVGQ